MNQQTLSDSNQPTSRGYTVVELMIAVSIVALVAIIAIPIYKAGRTIAQRNDLVNELRVLTEAFVIYAADHGDLPPSQLRPQRVPGGMETYMPKNNTWEDSPSSGGYWFWLSAPDHRWGYNGYITIASTGLPDEEVEKLDQKLDDGNLRAGAIRKPGPLLFVGVR